MTAGSAAQGASLPSAVLLDMDGTIVDSEPIWLAAEFEVMGALDGPWTDADQEACLGGPLEKVVAYMLDRAGSDWTPTAVQDLLLDVVERRMREADLLWRPGARALVLSCLEQQVPMALVTASWRRLVDAMHEAIAADLGVEPFTVIVAGDDVSESKPHPEPYLTASALLDAEPGDCLAIEDSPTGIRSAVAAGCVVLAVPHMAPVPPDVDPAVVRSLDGVTLSELWAISRHR